MKGLAPALFAAATFPLPGYFMLGQWERVAAHGFSGGIGLFAVLSSLHALCSFCFSLLAWRFAENMSRSGVARFFAKFVMATGLVVAMQGAFFLFGLVLDFSSALLPFAFYAAFAVAPLACILIWRGAFEDISGPLVVARNALPNQPPTANR